MNKNEKNQLENDEMYLLLLRIQEQIIQMVKEGYRIEEQEEDEEE